MNIISINNITFKQYKNTKYYCDTNGNIYSEYSQKIIKPLTRSKKNKRYPYIDINFGSGQKHCQIHSIVYETWLGEIPEGAYVLHKDDNQFNNNINNLYLSDQKTNIQDCIVNDHGVGNMWILTVYDSKIEKTLTFCPSNKFIEYCGHSCSNGNVNRMFGKLWFKKRYKIIDYRKCETLEIRKGVTTMGDECNPVG